MIYEYTIWTSAKKVTILTETPHTDFASIDEWIRIHKPQIAKAANASPIGLKTYGIYHGKRKIK